MKKLLKPFDYIFVLRPVLFFPVWTVFLAGYYGQEKTAVAAELHGMNGAGSAGGISFLWVGLALTLLMGAIFILHQVMERKSENRSRNLRLIAPNYLTPKAAFIEAVVLALGAILFSFMLSWKLGVVFVGLLLITGLLYSFSPFNFKDKPIAAVLTAALGAFLIFLAGWLLNGQVSKELLVYAVPYVSVIIAIFIITTLPDEEGAPSGASSFGAKYGLAVTVYTGLFFDLIAVISAYVLQDELIFYPAFFSLPFFVWAGMSLKLHDVARAMKYPIFLLALTICFKWGIEHDSFTLFLGLVGVYFVSKLYYRLRFGVNYPSL
ncbi:MAG: UbiA family prenyltransferase [bacterium]